MRPFRSANPPWLAAALAFGLAACAASPVGQPCALDADCASNLCLAPAPDAGATCQCNGTGGACASNTDCCGEGAVCCQGDCEPGSCLPP